MEHHDSAGREPRYSNRSHREGKMCSSVLSFALHTVHGFIYIQCFEKVFTLFLVSLHICDT